MKQNHFAMLLAALSLTVTSVQAQTFDSVEDLKHRGIAASPRSQEAFPWLARAGSRAATAVRPAITHSGFASAPRTVEEYPHLARLSAPMKIGGMPDITLMKNRAFVASPRMQEELAAFPQVRTSGSSESFQVAPLK